MASPARSADVCRECSGSGRAAIETTSAGSQLGDCPACTRACRKCRMVGFEAAMTEGFCDDCITRQVKSMVEVTAVADIGAEDAIDQLATEYRYSRDPFRGIPGVA